ncbi:hypothetical protein NL676_000030 [Syzygium grande]|nr:hypothetical protein NL676_000030 [Syzygium grande]
MKNQPRFCEALGVRSRLYGPRRGEEVISDDTLLGSSSSSTASELRRGYNIPFLLPLAALRRWRLWRPRSTGRHTAHITFSSALAFAQCHAALSSMIFSRR